MPPTGEESRRGRRTHIAQRQYQDPQGRRGVRLQFYLQGVRGDGAGDGVGFDTGVDVAAAGTGEEPRHGAPGLQGGLPGQHADQVPHGRGEHRHNQHQLHRHKPCLPLQIENMLKNTVIVVDNRGKLWSQGAALE